MAAISESSVRRSSVRLILASALLLLAAAPAVPESAKGQCKDRCSSNYQLCLKRSTTAKGRSECRAQRSKCKGTCAPPAHH